MSFSTWPIPLSYLAWPSMRSRRYGWGQMSCSKLTMHWGPCQRAWDSLEWYPHQSPQRLWDWWAYMIWMHCATSAGWPTVLGVGRRAKMRAQLSTTSGQYILGFVSCAINVSATHPPHQTLSAATASRTANPQEREAPMNHPHQHNCQQEAYGVNLTKMGTWTEDSWEIQASPKAALSGISPPHWCGPRREPDGEGSTHQSNTSHHLSPSTRLDQMATAFSQSRTIQDVYQRCWALWT